MSQYGDEGLDPADWEALRALGHRMLDDMLAYLRGVRERRVWTSPPAEVRRRLAEPVPVAPQGLERAYADFSELVLPYPTGNIHPRFWGWVIGTGSPSAMLAEMLAAGMNPNVGGFDDAASLVEDRVLAWLVELMGLPPGAGGLLVSGGSMANLLGLAVARNTRAGFEVRARGLHGARLTLYASQETHSSVRKAVELLGLGSDALRLVPVDRHYQVDIAALRAQVAADRAAGLRPFCLVGNAGTVNTGAIDDLAALADLAAREGLHLHVDGAFGALAALVPELRSRLVGMERADSLAFDLHKWGYFPYEAGVVLVRDAEAQRRAFAVPASYLAAIDGGVAGREDRFADRGVQLSRGFRALKVWMGLKEHGVAKLARLIERNVGQARALAELVRATPELELLAPVSLNVVCFRYRAEGDCNAVNRRILVRLQEEGIAAPSHTVAGGAFALRVAITNHRSRSDDFEALVRESVRLGREIARAMPAARTA